jgi:hypothetical protein
MVVNCRHREAPVTAVNNRQKKVPVTVINNRHRKAPVTAINNRQNERTAQGDLTHLRRLAVSLRSDERCHSTLIPLEVRDFREQTERRGTASAMRRTS